MEDKDLVNIFDFEINIQYYSCLLFFTDYQNYCYKYE